MQTVPALIAGDDVRPYRAVAMDASTAAVDNTGDEADANESVVGIARGTNRSFDSALHADQSEGDYIELQEGNVVLWAAAGTIDTGDKLKSDGEGMATPIATTGTTIQNAYGIALQDAGAAGDIIRVFVRPESIRPALS